jgi:hypothetical protein
MCGLNCLSNTAINNKPIFLSEVVSFENFLCVESQDLQGIISHIYENMQLLGLWLPVGNRIVLRRDTYGVCGNGAEILGFEPWC